MPPRRKEPGEAGRSKIEKVEHAQVPPVRAVRGFSIAAALGRGRRGELQGRATRATARSRSIRRLDLRMRRAERRRVLGANWCAGKSTLLKLVAGETEPDQGGHGGALGASVKMGHFGQQTSTRGSARRRRHGLRVARSPRSLQAGTGALKSLAGCFGFSGDDVEEAVPRAVGRREGSGW